MVYVKSDGTVCQSPPVHERIIRFFFGIISFLIFFFKSLLGMDTSRSKSSSGGYFSGFRGSSGGGGGGGGGGGRPFGPGKGGGDGPNIRTMRDINPPTVRGVGGCPGGGCGM